MTLPRQVVPGRDYMITRRCSERRFFLRPDDDTNNAFIYCLALAATRAKVQVTFSAAMSNHHHTGIHDPDGNFPVFTEQFHGLLARCQNAHLGRFENFWSSEPTSVVHLAEPNDILDKMTYAFPQVAAKNKWARIEALNRNRSFVERYRDAFLGHIAGLASIVFPFGTYWMRRFGKVACETTEMVSEAICDQALAPTPS